MLDPGPDTGAVEIAGDPAHPERLYASLWQVRRHPWLDYFQPTEGPGSAVYSSIDGGRTWTPAGRAGWPEGDLGRIALAVPPGSDGAQGLGGGLRQGALRVGDGGATWTLLNEDGSLANSYMANLTADPRDSARLWVDGPRPPPVGRRRQELHDRQGSARRRRLPHPLDRSGGQPAHDHRRRPGGRRDPERRRLLEQLVQPADGPVLSPRGRPPIPLLDLQRAAGHRHGRHREPQRLRPAHLPRLASGRRRRARRRHPRSGESRHRLRRRPRRPPFEMERAHRRGAERVALAGRELRRAPRHHALPLQLDHPGRDLAPPAACDLPGRPGPLPLARRRRIVEHREPGSHGRGGRRDRLRRRRAGGARHRLRLRRHLRHRALSGRRRAGLGRHRQRPRAADARRRRDLGRTSRLRASATGAR